MDLLALHRANPQRYPILLESVAGNRNTTARYSLLLAYPGDSIELTTEGLFENGKASADSDFLDCLNQRLQSLAAPEPEQGDRLFNGGWFLYLSYELANQVEPSLDLPRAQGSLPIALAVRCPAAILLDHQTGQHRIVVEIDHPDYNSLSAQMQADIAALLSSSEAPKLPLVRFEEEADDLFLNSVARIQEYIRAGDVFQVNLSRRWTLQTAEPVDPTALYANLRSANPAPFSGLFQWHDAAVISSSPERLIEVRGRALQTRPIAGTRPRESTEAGDAAMREELLLHPKERAEHVMLIDLERNDLGRVCEPGSVEVDELLGLETYAHVHHIVSNVRGQLRTESTAVDAIRAVFPGGTITGCPKVRCMEIIAELEQTGRGPYTGAMGYLDRSGNLDLNILIRSLQAEGGQIQFRAGAGIVADSDPIAELAETRAKARGLLRALGVND